mmetsp:Transcript_19098/g.44964  ORF Transcript_19098/g.44964 Transcript_19098/m.44964 type:complete len:280 (-) Transcript_19098:525-1364(-)
MVLFRPSRHAFRPRIDFRPPVWAAVLPIPFGLSMIVSYHRISRDCWTRLELVECDVSRLLENPKALGERDEGCVLLEMVMMANPSTLQRKTALGDVPSTTQRIEGPAFEKSDPAFHRWSPPNISIARPLVAKTNRRSCPPASRTIDPRFATIESLLGSLGALDASGVRAKRQGRGGHLVPSSLLLPSVESSNRLDDNPNVVAPLQSWFDSIPHWRRQSPHQRVRNFAKSLGVVSILPVALLFRFDSYDVVASFPFCRPEIATCVVPTHPFVQWSRWPAS